LSSLFWCGFVFNFCFLVNCLFSLSTSENNFALCHDLKIIILEKERGLGNTKSAYFGFGFIFSTQYIYILSERLAIHAHYKRLLLVMHHTCSFDLCSVFR